MKNVPRFWMKSESWSPLSGENKLYQKINTSRQSDKLGISKQLEAAIFLNQ